MAMPPGGFGLGHRHRSSMQVRAAGTGARPIRSRSATKRASSWSGSSIGWMPGHLHPNGVLEPHDPAREDAVACEPEVLQHRRTRQERHAAADQNRDDRGLDGVYEIQVEQAPKELAS